MSSQAKQIDVKIEDERSNITNHDVVEGSICILLFVYYLEKKKEKWFIK
jgi:hypothetical protein